MAKHKARGHAFLLQTADMKWTVYVSIDLEQEHPLKSAVVAEEGICLFSDAVEVAAKHGYGSSGVVVQYMKRGNACRAV